MCLRNAREPQFGCVLLRLAPSDPTKGPPLTRLARQRGLRILYVAAICLIARLLLPRLSSRRLLNETSRSIPRSELMRPSVDITVMIPMHGYHAAGDSAYDSSYEFAKLMNSMFDPDSFTMLILNHQVQCVSAAHGVQAKFGALPSLGPVWARLFNQMAISVSNLNRYMALAQDGYFVLHRVCDLINTEVTLRA